MSRTRGRPEYVLYFARDGTHGQRVHNPSKALSALVLALNLANSLRVSYKSQRHIGHHVPPVEVTNQLSQRKSMMKVDSKEVDLSSIDHTAMDHRLLPSTHIRYAARVMYEGTHFSGMVPHRGTYYRTVQGELEVALNSIFNETILVQSASRTDAGVHAHGQCVHFDVPVNSVFLCKRKFTTKLLESRLNLVLPDDVRVYNIAAAPVCTSIDGLPWHARFQSCGKLYKYHFIVEGTQSPFRRHTQAHYSKGKGSYYGEMNMSRLREVIPLFVGKLNFSSFTNKKVVAGKNYIRTITRMDLLSDGDLNEWCLEVELDGALYHMVRNIVATLWAYGASLLTHENITDLFDGRKPQRGYPIHAAPANGLTLFKVHYDQYN